MMALKGKSDIIEGFFLCEYNIVESKNIIQHKSPINKKILTQICSTFPCIVIYHVNFIIAHT